jgi:hypothetical protein
MSIEGFIEFLLRHRGERGSPLSAEDAGYLALIFLSAGCCFVLTAIHQWHHRVDVLEERRVQQRADIRRGGLPVERRHLRPEEGWVLLYVYGPSGLVLLGVGVVHLAFGASPPTRSCSASPSGSWPRSPAVASWRCTRGSRRGWCRPGAGTCGASAWPRRPRSGSPTASAGTSRVGFCPPRIRSPSWLAGRPIR